MAMRDVTGYSSMQYGTGSRRYSPGARAFHWVTALLMFAVVPLGWIFAEFKETPGPRSIYVSAHKTIGLLIFAIVVVRILYRIFNPPPALPGRMAQWEQILAKSTHWLLYAILIIMPVSGYLLSSSGKYPITVFGLWDFPKLPVSKEIGESAKQAHLLVQYAVYALVIAHVAATAFHLMVKRDAILDRMLPRQANAD